MSPIIGLGLGALGMMAQSRQAKAQNAAQESAQQSQNMMAMMAAQQQQQQNAMYQQQRMQDEQMAKQQSDAAKATIPLGDASLKGLGTIATSPLGDQTDPYTGRQRILGG